MQTPSTFEMLKILYRYFLSDYYNMDINRFISAYNKAPDKKKRIADEMIRRLYDAIIEIRIIENSYKEKILSIATGKPPPTISEEDAREEALFQVRGISDVSTRMYIVNDTIVTIYWVLAK